MSVGVPIKVLHDAEGHIVTVESINGEIFRGKLIEAEDNMNIQMSDIVMTYRDGRTYNITNLYIRGSKIRFLILPDMLKNSPMLKKPEGMRGMGGSRGKSGMIRSAVGGGRARPFRGRGGPPMSGGGSRGSMGGGGGGGRRY